MNILVCIKQVPGSSNVEVDSVTGVLKRDGVQSKMNPYDLYALEIALSLKETYGGNVEVITMGPPQAKNIVIEAICMGASGGTIISDRKFAGADVLATAYTISQGIKKCGEFDLIICGKQTTDGDTAQVGAEVSEFLNIPNVANVLSVEKVCDKKIYLKASLDEKIVEMSVKTPCLISTELDDKAWEDTLNICFDRMYKKAEEMGGLVSGEHGIGFAKKEYLRKLYREKHIFIMQGIKKVFDEKNILNPGKICF